jgi:preprotein translocase subunit SecG
MFFQTLILVIHVIVCIALILIILLQTGKGADIGAAFGGGSSNTVFGSSGAGTFLSKVTVGAAVVFMITSIFLTYFAGRAASVGDRSVMSGQAAPVKEVPGQEGQAAPPVSAEAQQSAGQPPVEKGAPAPVSGEVPASVPAQAPTPPAEQSPPAAK